jgi:hypothetical protein
MEHRWGERLEVTLPVRIRAAYGLVGSGRVINFSVSGALVATSLPVALLSRVRVSFVSAHRPRSRTRISSSTFEGLVVRRHAAGFAVEWCDFGTDEMVALANSNRSGRSAAAAAVSFAGYSAKG